MLTVGLAGAHDTRDAADVPTRGTLVGVVLRRFVPLDVGAVPGNRGPEPFTRVAIDGRAFWPLGSPDHVVAVRLLASADSSAPDAPTPFYFQHWLGGSHTLRAFSSCRFRGEALAHASAEYRWRVVGWLDVSPFVDVGTVAAAVARLSRSATHVAIGAGLRVRDDDSVWARLDWARGGEGHRLLLSFGPAF